MENRSAQHEGREAVVGDRREMCEDQAQRFEQVKGRGLKANARHYESCIEHSGIILSGCVILHVAAYITVRCCTNATDRMGESKNLMKQNVPLEVSNVSKKKETGVAKLFIRANAYYVFSKKRKPSSKSDHHLELMGGHIEDGESPLKALIREVKEEELSSVIATKTKRQRPKGKRVDVDGENHFIFKISVDGDDFNNMRPDGKESYGFVKVEADVIEEKDKLNNNLSRFTPKTGEIFRALGLV